MESSKQEEAWYKVRKDKEDKEWARLSGLAGDFLPTMMEAH